MGYVLLSITIGRFSITIDKRNGVCYLGVVDLALLPQLIVARWDFEIPHSLFEGL